MKLIFAETKHNYEKYLFPYQVLLWSEKKEEIEKIYAKGFLPFRHRRNLFYLSRSSRCDLEKFILSSENRRILKKTKALVLKKLTINKFNYSPTVQKNCKNWAKSRGWKISTKSLKYIFSGQFFNRIWVWQEKKTGGIAGYQILFEEKNIIHTAHVFYNPEFTSSGLGTRMILEATIWSKENKKKFHYLGTCYGKTGFYKRSISGFEFFNGFTWSANLEELAYLNQREGSDYLLREKEYLKKFWRWKKNGFTSSA